MGRHRQISEDDIRWIYLLSHLSKRNRKGLTVSKIAQLWNVHHSTVSLIKNKVRYTDITDPMDLK